jgi:hypothetical protein
MNEGVPLATNGAYQSFIFFGFLVAGEEIESEWRVLCLVSYLLTSHRPA